MQFTRSAAAVLKHNPNPKPKAKPRPLTPMQLAAKALNLEQCKRGARAREVPVKTDWSQYPLGERPDPEVAKLAGVSKQTVFRARKELGIAAYSEEAK